jgi:hypothetical protein
VTEALRSMTDDELGAAVSMAGLDLAWPEPGDLAGRVLTRVRAEPPRVVRLPLSRRTKTLLLAAALTLLLAGAAVAAKLVIDLGAVVVRVPEGTGQLPTPSSPSFGAPISLDEAAALIGTRPALPSELGPPDRVWADRIVTDRGEVVRLTFAWRPRRGLPPIESTRWGAVLMRFEGDLDQAFKDVYQDTGDVRSVRVGDREAFWTTGPHRLDLVTGDGVVSTQVVGNVLLWRDGSLTFRLETAVTRAEALRIAGSIPGTS